MIYVVLQKNLKTGYTCVAGVIDTKALAEQEIEISLTIVVMMATSIYLFGI